MTVIGRCPNTACGRVSRLGEDPLGRIFRCPRCLTRLPAAPASAADSGWAMMGVRTSRSSSMGLMVHVASHHSGDRQIVNGVITRAGTSSAFESGEWAVAGPSEGLIDEPVSYAALDELSGHNDSGQLCVGPFSRTGPSVSSVGDVGASAFGASAFSKGDGGGSSVEQSTSESDTVASDGVSARVVSLGRFRFVDVLGEGRSATVYRAYDPILERDVAIKVLRRGDPKAAKSLERFLGEARALARLRHPRIVPVYDAGRAGERYFIAMALIEGRSLADRLREGPLGYQRAAEVVVELADALCYAHEQGIVHRDVKPANIHVDARGEIYLMDFGIAYRPDSGEVPVPPGTILGTPAYVAPEQAKGGQTEVLAASDQYSLGAVFYELLCGQPPFSGPPSYVLFHVIHHEPASPRQIAGKVPPELAAVCMKALAKRPELRYTDCGELAEDLRRWLRGEIPVVYRRPRTRLGR